MNDNDKTPGTIGLQKQTRFSWEDEEEASEGELKGMGRCVITIFGTMAICIITLILLLVF